MFSLACIILTPSPVDFDPPEVLLPLTKTSLGALVPQGFTLFIHRARIQSRPSLPCSFSVCINQALRIGSPSAGSKVLVRCRIAFGAAEICNSRFGSNQPRAMPSLDVERPTGLLL